MRIEELIARSRDGQILDVEQLAALLALPPTSEEAYRAMAEARRVSSELSGGQAEVHAQFALNLAPCPCNCAFCSFAQANGVFTGETRLSPEQAVAQARQFEADGANAVFLMTTAQYPFGLFLEMAAEVRRALRPQTPLVANVGDQSAADARRLADAGFAGVYHALRLREGTDTSLSPERRRRSIRHFQEAGLRVGTCVEPVGPEHGDRELAEMIAFTAAIGPAYGGAARRIAIPGTAMAARGMIGELRLAQVVAVARLGMPRAVIGNCTHEPGALGAAAGANLFWAEAGANPRDVQARTEEGRGATVADCATLFGEAAWEVWSGPSRFYA